MRKKKKVKEEENNLMEIKANRDQLFKCISRVQNIIEQNHLHNFDLAQKEL